MAGRILILGAAGRLGHAAAEAFRDAGWTVASATRARSIAAIAAGTQPIEVDALDAGSVATAAQGADVILHALNPPYTQWRRLALPLAESALHAARSSGATLMLPGNLYNYGSPLPPVVDEAMPMRPTSRKGALRVDIEARYRAAAQDGVRCIVLRAGDFYGSGVGSWFDRVIINNIASGDVVYPGPTDRRHAWAYLPDLAATLVRLAENRDRLAPFDCFGFSGHTVTGDELVAALAAATGRSLSVSAMPWLALRLLSPVVPIFRELSEMAYLWREPHAIDGDKLQAAIEFVPSTPFATAVRGALLALGIQRRTPLSG
jgi:nucleoside-diphosphate-sugar epimerase